MMSEPGAARFGNFPDYYKFNPTLERMKYVKLLSNENISNLLHCDAVRCLDIGCNTGVSNDK